MDDVIAKVELPRRRFTREEYHRMGELGILRREERVELIEGEIMQMSPIGQRHVVCLGELTRRLLFGAGDRAVLWPQSPVRLPWETEPQPDIVLVRPGPERYLTRQAHPDDVLLLVEIADTSYRYDRRVKLPLYARADVREVWIVDLAHDAVEVHRRPHPAGYESFERVEAGGRIAPIAFPDVVITVDTLLLAR